MQKFKKILIIYENTGAGHKKTAEMLAEYLSDAAISIQLITNSELINAPRNIFVKGWNSLVKRNWLKAADLFVNFIPRIFFLPFFYVIFPKKLSKNLDILNPDIIISTSDVNRLIGGYAKSRGIPFYIFLTSGSIFVDRLHPHATHLVYFKETKKIIQSLSQTGYFKRNIDDKTPFHDKMTDACRLLFRHSLFYKRSPYFIRYQNTLKKQNDLKVKVLGPLREKAFYNQTGKADVLQRYQLPTDGAYILISSGRFGGKLVKKIIQEILGVHDSFKGIKLNLIAVCGNDHLLTRFIQKLPSPANIRLITLHNQKTLGEFYHLADCSIGRGTSGILMDSLISRTPLIVLNKITSNDFGTLDIIQKYHVGAIANDVSEIPALLNKILPNKETYTNAIDSLTSRYGSSSCQEAREKIQSAILLMSSHDKCRNC